MFSLGPDSTLDVSTCNNKQRAGTWVDLQLLKTQLCGEAGVGVGRQGVCECLEDGLVHGETNQSERGEEGRKDGGGEKNRKNAYFFTC